MYKWYSQNLILKNIRVYLQFYINFYKFWSGSKFQLGCCTQFDIFRTRTNSSLNSLPQLWPKCQVINIYVKEIDKINFNLIYLWRSSVVDLWLNINLIVFFNKYISRKFRNNWNNIYIIWSFVKESVIKWNENPVHSKKYKY